MGPISTIAGVVVGAQLATTPSSTWDPRPEVVLYRFDNGWTFSRVIRDAMLEEIATAFDISITQLSPHSMRNIDLRVFLVLRDEEGQPMAMVVLDRERHADTRKRVGLWFPSLIRLLPTSYASQQRRSLEDLTRRAVRTLLFDWLELSTDALPYKARIRLQTGYVVPDLQVVRKTGSSGLSRVLSGLKDNGVRPPYGYDFALRNYIDRVLFRLIEGMGVIGSGEVRQALLGEKGPYYAYRTTRTHEGNPWGYEWRWMGATQGDPHARMQLIVGAVADPDRQTLTWTMPPAKTSTDSLFDLLRRTSLLKSFDEWNNELDMTVLPGQPTFELGLEAYALLDEQPPVLWPLLEFKAWSKGLPDA